MKIEINSGGLQGNAMIDEMKAEVGKILANSLRLDSAFSRIKSYAMYTNGSAQNVNEAIRLIEERERAEQQRAENIRDASRQVETFINNTRNVDKAVAQTIDKSYNNQNNSGKSGGNQTISDEDFNKIMEIYEKSRKQLDNAGFWDSTLITKAINEIVKKIIEEKYNDLTEEQRKKFDEAKYRLDRLDKFFDKMDSRYRKDIYNIIDNMGEPAKSLYLDNFDKAKLGKLDVSGVFSWPSNTVNLNMAEEPNNPRGSYVTFFHESGHSIDCNYGRQPGDDTYRMYSHSYVYNGSNSEYPDLTGKTLYWAIQQDVRDLMNDVTKELMRDMWWINEEERQHVVDYVMGARSIPESQLTPDEKTLYDSLNEYFNQNFYKDQKSGAKNEALTDMLSGITNNTIQVGLGHYPKASKGETLENYRYWYNADGTPTNKQSSELFAEYYSYLATGSNENMNVIRKYLKRSAIVLDQMVNDMSSGA